MNLIIHRGSKEIGGNCIELATESSRILVDIGTPLPPLDGKPVRETIPSTLKASLAKKNPPLSGILISHPHQDHYGLLDKVNKEIPIFTGKASAVLIKLGFEIKRKHGYPFKPITFGNRKSFTIGDFQVTPYLMDHSGFDSYAFLISSGEKKIFYSGDFRDHGIKRKALPTLLRHIKAVDALLMEGTLVGKKEEKETVSEDNLIGRFALIMENTRGPVFITLSGMNIDRLVILVKACNKAKRMLAFDPYVAEITDRLSKVEYAPSRYFKLPRPGKDIHVCYPKELCKWLEANGNSFIIKRHLRNGKPWEFFKANSNRLVMFAKPSYSKEILDKYYFDLSKSSWIYSMWHGYLKNDSKMAVFKEKMIEKGVKFYDIHTSGHASIEAMKKLAHGIQYKTLIPVHTEHPEIFKNLFKNTLVVSDGEIITI